MYKQPGRERALKFNVKHLTIWLLAIVLCACSYEEPSHPTVLASIKPLYLIAQRIGGDEVAVDLLLTGSGDPHAYSMRVSDMRKLKSAQAYLLVGPTFEVFLTNALASQGSKPMHHMLSADHDHEHNEHHESAEHSSHHAHESRHPWLNVHRAVQAAEDYAVLFAELSPEHKSIFVQRAAQFKHEVLLDFQKLKQALSMHQTKHYVVNHNAYQDFSEVFDLQLGMSMTDASGQALSAQRLQSLLGYAEEASCFIAESDVLANQKKAALLDLPLITIDPLGWVDNVDSYQALLRYVAEQFQSCFNAQ